MCRALPVLHVLLISYEHHVLNNLLPYGNCRCQLVKPRNIRVSCRIHQLQASVLVPAEDYITDDKTVYVWLCVEGAAAALRLSSIS